MSSKCHISGCEKQMLRILRVPCICFDLLCLLWCHHHLISAASKYLISHFLSRSQSSVHIVFTAWIIITRHHIRPTCCTRPVMCLFSILSQALLIWSSTGSPRGCQHWPLALIWSQLKPKILRRWTIQPRKKIVLLRHHQIKNKEKQKKWCLCVSVWTFQRFRLKYYNVWVYFIVTTKTIYNMKSHKCVANPLNLNPVVTASVNIMLWLWISHVWISSDLQFDW